MSLTESLKDAAGALRARLIPDGPRVPVVRMEGMIASGGRASGTLSLQRVEKLLDKAFAMKDAPAVALLINSPGGSPVQSKLIHQRIRQLSEEKKKPVIVFCEDMAASGGYMIACAGEEIFCDGSSIMGSIGVISASFGFTDAMERVGVERRMKTAGESKVLTDPFSPETDEQKKRLETILERMHAQFIELVKSRRSEKLADDPELFTGAVYIGVDAVEAGLADGEADLRAELRERYGESVRIRYLAPKSKGPLSRVFAGAADALVEAMETRAAWGRFGL